MKFNFGSYTTKVIITNELQPVTENCALFVCDENTKQYAEILRGNNPICVLKSGEENKNWDSVTKILQAAFDAGLNRKSVLIGVGGGVIGDLTGFAASVYMRGCGFRLVATTLLAMIDASIGGKTGFDFFGVKNFAGTFYPAQSVYMPLETLNTLPEKEWKSGLAELIKTMILLGNRELGMGNGLVNIFSKNYLDASRADNKHRRCRIASSTLLPTPYSLLPIIKKAVKFKGKLVEKDFLETKGKRALLNLGHTFGHALESSAGFGKITHGEAVAWGIYKACELGVKLNITPQKRANMITDILKKLGYDVSSPHPLEHTQEFRNALLKDKKNLNKDIAFIIPNKKSAQKKEVSMEFLINNKLIEDKISA